MASSSGYAQSVDFKTEQTRTSESDNNTIYKTYFRRGKNLPAYDDRRIHYGFYIGTNFSTFNIEPSQNYVNQLKDPAFSADSTVFTSINPVPNLGFTTGFIFNVRLDENIDFRILPSVSFFSRFVEYRRRDEKLFNQLNRFTFSFVELPILFKFKSQRRHNTRAYLLAGIKPSWEVGSRRDEQGTDELRANNADFSVDVGGGFDFYYPYFKFSPEVRFSFGLSDLKFPDNNKFSRAVGRMNTYTVTFLLNFE